MSASAQAARSERKGASGRLVLAAVLAATLPACMSSKNLGLSDEPETDASILTSSVDASYETLRSSQSISDQATIRNAVSSANLEELGAKPLSWANAETRSRGAITNVVETRGKDVLCRSFKTSRESFDGVAVFSGEVCLGREGAWYMRSFAAS